MNYGERQNVPTIMIIHHTNHHDYRQVDQQIIHVDIKYEYSVCKVIVVK